MIDIRLQKLLQSSKGVMNLDVHLNFEEGESYCLFGESGAGKTSILRMISGLMNPDSGFIKIGEDVLFDSNNKINKKAQKRNIGLLFQDFALFPNMDVEQNIFYGANADFDRKSIYEMIESLGLEGLEKRDVHSLSGGQKQRVALARSIAQKPRLLLLDEPLSSLDGKIRYDIQKLLLDIKKEYEISIILVTHDISEVVNLADHVSIIKDGQIIRTGKASEVFTHGTFSAKFQFVGKIVNIEQQGFMTILSVMVGNDLIKVVDDSKYDTYVVGDEVLIGSKAFNPIIQKIT